MTFKSNSLELHIHDGHNSSMLISDFQSGKVLFAANEERFTRKKNQEGFPINAIKKSQDFLDYKLEDIKNIYFSTRTIPFNVSHSQYNFFRELFVFLGLFLPANFFSSKPITKIYLLLSSFLRKKQAINNLKKFGLKNKNIKFYDHHYCHAASTMGFSENIKKNEILIFTLDASGDAKSGSVSIFKSDKFKVIETMHTVDSLGEVYSQVTALLKMKPMEHEYKLMGLAPYCKKEFAQKVCNVLKKKIISFQFDDNGYLRIKSKKGLWGKQLYKQLERELKTFRFDAIAAGVQLLIEEIAVIWIKFWIKETNIKDIALGGGVFMNVKLNKIIAELQEVNTITVVPSSGDESLVFGSWVLSNIKRNLNQNFNQNYIYGQAAQTGLLIGNSYSQDEVKNEIDKYMNKKIDNKNIRRFEGEEIDNLAVDLLIKGKVGARFKGRMEFGARSLGNRSIIASPLKTKQIRNINEAIKSRDFWMPFAPVVIDKEASKFYQISKQKIGCYQFMQTAVDAKEFAIENTPATLHPYDRTARPQVLKKEINPSFYELISIFNQKSGLSVLLNTSFNFHGFPVVENPHNALEVFFSSGIDFLIIEDTLLVKEESDLPK